MCAQRPDGCLDRRAGFELAPAVIPLGGPSAPAKSAREEAVWGLLWRPRVFSSNRQAPRAPDVGRRHENPPSWLTARSCRVDLR
mgnify:CR=1 FL=1